MPTFQVTDDFNRTDANPTSGDWATNFGLNATQIVGNEVRPTTTGGGGNHSVYTLVVSDDHMSTVTVVTLSGTNPQARAIARGSVATQLDCYFYIAYGFGGSAPVELSKYVAGAFATIGSGGTTSFSSGGNISCDAVGTTIRGLTNGVQKYSVTDTGIATGRMGIGAYTDTSAASVELDNFQGDYTFAQAGPTSTSMGSQIWLW